MKKILLWILVLTMCISMVASFSLVGCKEEAAEEEVAEEEAAEEEVAEEEVAEEEAGYLWGEEALFQGDEFLITLTRAAQYYAADQGDVFVSLNPFLSVEAQIRDIRYMVTGMKVDGIMTSPLDEAALVETIEWSIDQGVPVVCYNTDVKTAKMPLSILVSNEKFGEAAADGLIKEIEKDGVEVKGKVIIIGNGSLDDPWVPKRMGGIKAGFKEFPEIEFIEYPIEGAAVELAKQKVIEGITAFGKPLAVFGTNATTNVGVIEGLKAMNMYVKRGETGHVYLGTLDTPSIVRDALIEGFVDASADQPNLAYGFLPIYFLRLIKMKGVDALPAIGSTVTCDPSKPEGPQEDGTWNAVIKGEEHEGVKPTDMTYWAPAEVVEYYGHRWLQVGLYVSTTETIKEAPIWINVIDKWLK